MNTPDKPLWIAYVDFEDGRPICSQELKSPELGIEQEPWAVKYERFSSGFRFGSCEDIEGGRFAVAAIGKTSREAYLRAQKASAKDLQ